MNSSNATGQPDVRDGLQSIGLRGAAAGLEQLLTRVPKGKEQLHHFLADLIAIELQDRSRRGLERRLKRSRIGAFKPAADFDWNWPSKIDRERMERILALRFIDERTNVVLIGAHGLGKTTLLKNIAHRAVVAGHATLLLTASRLLSDLSSQESARTLERRIRHYAAISILCVDELGYLSYDTRAADLLFELVSRRHETRKPILLTTNLAFSDWPTVFPSATSTVALVDRLTHFAEIIKIEGESWRRKESLERQQQTPRP